MKKLLLAVVIQMLFQILIFAQPKWEINIFGGVSNYLGDLVQTPLPYLNSTKQAYGLGITYLAKPSMAFEFNALRANLTGDDKNIEGVYFSRRSISFDSQISEFSITARWEPFAGIRYKSYGIFRAIISPYIFAGAAVIHVNAVPDFTNVTRQSYFELIDRDIKNNTQSMAFAIPVGGGIRFDLGKRTAIDLRAAIRATSTDYLDGISESGNPNANDWYMTGGLNLVFRLGDPDSDKDGIADREDLCPLVAGVISAKGCPDADGDGVEDLEDLCPYKAGILDLNGCPDRDGDGVTDMEDDCPGLAGQPETNGCPDRDGDRIRDAKDNCPGEKGTKLLDGCPDCDNDGVDNAYDKCPEISGSPEYAGCPIELYDRDEDGFLNDEDECPDKPGTVKGCPDTDGDGIADYLDKCPLVMGQNSSQGCPELTKKEKEELEMATKGIKFETGSAVLKPESVNSLDKVAAILAKYPNFDIEIIGHTDNVGDESNNQKLSEKRAKACFNYFIKSGISTDRMQFTGMGESSPVATNKTLQGRKLNRRVEIKLNQ